MPERPQRLISRLVEYAALFALATFLVRVGVCYLTQVWPALLILAVIAVGGVIIYRIRKNRPNW